MAIPIYRPKEEAINLLNKEGDTDLEDRVMERIMEIKKAGGRSALQRAAHHWGIHETRGRRESWIIREMFRKLMRAIGEVLRAIGNKLPGRSSKPASLPA